MRHEIGLLVGENSHQGRFEFSRNLQLRLLAARASGVEITSIATRGPHRIEHLDLLVKHGIRVVRQNALRSEDRDAERFGWAAASTLRFGISNLPATLYVTEPPRWSRWTKGWEERRQITAAACRRQYCHLTIDAHQLTGASARRSVQATLHTAAKLFHGTGCRVETITSLAASLMARPLVRAAQSILQAA
jgi:hypothetical protein